MNAMPSIKSLATLIAALTLSATAAADVIYTTADPFGGQHGVTGADIYNKQSVALRFIPDRDYSLNTVALWFMNNSSQTFGNVTLTVRDNKNTDYDTSVPGSTIFERWDFTISASGWEPNQEHLISKRHPLLKKGGQYWLVAESHMTETVNPVWNYAASGFGYSAYTDKNGVWQNGGSAAALTATIEGTPLKIDQ